MNSEELEIKQMEIKEAIVKLAREKEVLQIEQSESEKQTKLEERRISVIAKKKVIEKYLKDYPNASRFVSQTNNFNSHCDNYEEAKKDASLDYTREMELISKVNFQYNRCVDILVNDLNNSILVFRNALLEWQNKIDQRLKKLEKVKD